MANGANDNTKRPGRRIGSRRAGSFAAVLIGASLAVAACGGGSDGPGVASAGSSSTAPAKSSPSSAKKSALAYSTCMRGHGVPNFPDPDSKGQIVVQGTQENGLGPDSPQMKAAVQACKSLEPRPSAQQQRQDYAKTLRFAKCMRANGVPKFPDPQAPGSGPQTGSQKKPSSGDQDQPDPSSPQFKSAMQGCQQYLPGGAEINTESGSAER
ncbi:MAG: hypothetical protein V7607_1705 [Solirubrobacteraceae bacterium]